MLPCYSSLPKMEDLKLQNLLGLALLVGPDSYSGLKYCKSSQKQSGLNSRKSSSRKSQYYLPGRSVKLKAEPGINILEHHYDASDKKHRYTVLKDSESDSEYDSDEEGMLDRLTRRSTSFLAEVTQIYSRETAQYHPNRPQERQLLNYPANLDTQLHSIYSSSKARARFRTSANAARRIEMPIDENATDLKPPDAGGRRSSGYSPWPLSRPSMAPVVEACVRIRRNTLASLVPTNNRKLSCTNSIPDPQGNGSVVMSRKTSEIPLNKDQIGALCQLSFPEGLGCYETRRPAMIVPYVLTNIDGERFYAVTLRFDRQFWIKEAGGGDEACDGRQETTKSCDFTLEECLSGKSDNITVFIPNCVILVSWQPYFDTLTDCLVSFYNSLDSSCADLDRELADLARSLTTVVIPPPESGYTVQVKIVASRPDTINVRSADHRTKPIVDIDLSIIAKLFKPAVICKILAALLTEQKIVFMSTNYSMLTLVQEAFMNLIYPLRWQSLYVPVLSESMVGLIEAPGYLVMGAHRGFYEDIKKVEGLFIVDIDAGIVIADGGFHVDLPLECSNNFCAKLVDLRVDFEREHIGQVFKDELKQRRQFKEKLNAEITDLALDLMVNLFGSVHSFIIHEQKFFNQPSFLERRSASSQEFYQLALYSAMFKQFLRERIAFAPQKDLFDERALALDELDMNRSAPRQSFRMQEKPLNTQHHSTSAVQNVLPFPLLENYQDTQEARLAQIESMSPSDSGGQNRLYKAALLYVQASLHNQQFSIQQAMACLLEINSLSPNLFPRKSALEMIDTMEDPQQMINFIRPEYRATFKELVREAATSVKRSSYDVKVDFENLPSATCDAITFHKYIERLDLASDRQTIDRLFNALTLDVTDDVKPEYIRAFYECWKENEAQCKEMEMTVQARAKRVLSETPLKVSSEPVRTDLGMGHLVMTQRKLLLLCDGLQHEPLQLLTFISDISRVEKVQIRVIFKETVEALRVSYESQPGKTGSVTLHLKQECRLWKILLQELVAGKKICKESKDIFMVKMVTQNVLLIDSLLASAQLSSPVCFHSRDPDKALSFLTYYSKPETRDHLIHNLGQNDLLVHRLNPNADEMDISAVECLLYVPGQAASGEPSHTAATLRSDNSSDLSPTLWCGMSSGKIRVFEAITWTLCPRYVKSADSRVVCLAYSGKHVWAGSFDHSIYVIENNPTSMAYERLMEHDDAVIDLRLAPDQTTMYSACLNGNIIMWDTKTLKPLYTVLTVNTTVLTSINPISMDEIWCCCKDRICMIDSSSQIRKDFIYVDENDRRVDLDCFMIIGDHLWAGCARLGRVVCWSIAEEVKLGTLPVSARGISCMSEINGTLYIGCKINYTRQRNGLQSRKADSTQQPVLGTSSHPETSDSPSSSSTPFRSLSVNTSSKSMLYIADSHEFALLNELPAHNDKISCLHSVRQQYVITGSGSNEGKIAIWKHQSEPNSLPIT